VLLIDRAGGPIGFHHCDQSDAKCSDNRLKSNAALAIAADEKVDVDQRVPCRAERNDIYRGMSATNK
jgi:hypothetical protein